VSGAQSPRPPGTRPVVRRSRVTLTDSCVEALSQAIESGAYRPGSPLPSEPVLSEQLGVSRPTLREALRLLQERGLIQRKHGKGTFVRERPIVKELNQNFGITSMIRAAGYTPSTGESTVTASHADADIAARLGLEEGAPIWQVERVRLADGRPVVFSTDIIAESLLSREDIKALGKGKENSFYSVLHKKGGVTISRGDADLAPCKSTPRLRDLLEVKQGVPLLCIRQVDFDQRGRPVVYSIEYHAADWVTFRLERFGPGSALIDS
jgi:GntR family transcriptional regulator